MAEPSSSKGDFAALRDAFTCLSEIYSLNGRISTGKPGLALASIPKYRWWDLSEAVRTNQDMIHKLISGSGQRSSVQGRSEVVLSVIARPGSDATFEICAMLVVGRGMITKTLTVNGSSPAWREQLQDFTDWSEIDSVIAAAEGNNQRAMIGMVLQLAGIGRGRLTLVEADLPEEIDEAAQSVRGADWLKAGLPRFESAAGEALWYLMRLRSLHARMVRQKKQGFYTSMALAAMHGSGLSLERMSSLCNLPEGLVERLTPRPGDSSPEKADLSSLGSAFVQVPDWPDDRMSYCADRVWRGAAIYARVLDRRVRLGASARKMLWAGEDIVTASGRLGISRRDLVRILSVKQSGAVAEKARFVEAIISPALIRKAAGD